MMSRSGVSDTADIVSLSGSLSGFLSQGTKNVERILTTLDSIDRTLTTILYTVSPLLPLIFIQFLGETQQPRPRPRPGHGSQYEHN